MILETRIEQIVCRIVLGLFCPLLKYTKNYGVRWAEVINGFHNVSASTFFVGVDRK